MVNSSSAKCVYAQKGTRRFLDSESASRNLISMLQCSRPISLVVRWHGGCPQDDGVYILPSDWWPEPIQERHVFLLVKSIYGKLQAARKWHILVYQLGWIIMAMRQLSARRLSSWSERMPCILSMAYFWCNDASILMWCNEGWIPSLI